MHKCYLNFYCYPQIITPTNFRYTFLIKNKCKIDYEKCCLDIRNQEIYFNPTPVINFLSNPDNQIT